MPRASRLSFIRTYAYVRRLEEKLLRGELIDLRLYLLGSSRLVRVFVCQSHKVKLGLDAHAAYLR